VYVGALEPQDGAAQLPQILERLVVDHGLTGARMTIAGWGSELEFIRSDFASRRLLERVRLLVGLCANTSRGSSRTRTSVSTRHPVIPFNHGTTMVKISEYLAFERPTVSYALRETQHTAAGAVALVPCDDSGAFARGVAELARSEEARAELHRRAMSRAGELLCEHQAANLIDAYDNVARRDGLKPS
jgi:hypothetical protein